MAEYLKSINPILLVRHGQSTSNTDPNVGGWQDPGLTPRGQQQAEAIADRLGELLKDRDIVVYTSHLKRAYMTAEKICSRLDCTPIIDEDLQEYRTNLDPHLSRQDAEKYKNPKTNPYKKWRTFRDAESLEELYYRAGRILTEIMDNHDEICVIVTHGWLMDKMMAWWIGMNVDDIKPNMFASGNTSLTVLSNTQFGERVILKLNDTTHLTEDLRDSFLD